MKHRLLFAVLGLVLAVPMVIPRVLPATANCPDGMARVNDFCIDRFEGSLVEVVSNTAERAYSPYHTPGRTVVKAVSRSGVVPQGYISERQASRACQMSGKRLCTDQEWVRACQGSRHTTFPYGNQRERGRCNENHDRHPVVQAFGLTKHNVWDSVHMNDPALNQLPGSLALSGAFEGCTNDFGVYDMVGNLHEWTSDPNGTFRGGYYMDTQINGDGCLYVTRGHDIEYHDYSTGFRCCSDVGDDH